MNFKKIFNKNNSPILLIILIGLVVRVVFTFNLAELFFNRASIFVDADTKSWSEAFVNLYKHGTYTNNFYKEYGYFNRMPGYSFFIGFFYIITGGNWLKAYPIIGLFQIVVDCFSIYILYLLSKNIFKSVHIALLTSLIYASYPFIIVWTPVVYSETISILLLFLSIYFLTKNTTYTNLFFTGLTIGIGVLFRPQLIYLAPLSILYLLIITQKIHLVLIKQSFVLTIAFILAYGAWPARNYINHNKIIFTQDLRGGWNWNEDVTSFAHYIHAVKPEWEPQFSQIVQNKPVDYPFLSAVSHEDTIKFQKVIFLSKQCGSGFAHWDNYWKQWFETPNCNMEIKKLYDELRENQIKNKPVEYYVTIPAMNLKKALFKSQLTKQQTLAQRLSVLLFYYRTLFIFLGIIGCIFLFKQKKEAFAFAVIALLYFIILYLTVCAGTTPQLRNVEIRYFLPADILMLIPAGYAVIRIINLILPLSPTLFPKGGNGQYNTNTFNS